MKIYFFLFDLRITNQLEEMFSPSILVNYLGSSVIICLVGFQATGKYSSNTDD